MDIEGYVEDPHRQELVKEVRKKIDELGVEYDRRGNVVVNRDKQTSVEKVFAAGDVEKGASLVVHAIEAGKNVAVGIQKFLTQNT